MNRRWTVVLCAPLLVAACTGHDDAGPTPTTQPAAPTTVVDRSGIALAAVRGSTTSTIVDRGTAELHGSVRGPAGLLAGATVRVERLVAGHSIRTDVLTGADGRFTLPGVPGGRYRVRAYLAPWYAQLQPVVQFLEDGEQHSFDLTVEEHSGLVVRADVAPDAPFVGGAVNLVASVTTRSVDPDGIVRAVPVVGVTVELGGLGRWVLRDDSAPEARSTTSTSRRLGPTSSTTTTPTRARPATAVTDASGRVRYELRCTQAGAPGLELRVPVSISAPPGSTPGTVPAARIESVALELPACADSSGPASTTTEASRGSETTPSR